MSRRPLAQAIGAAQASAVQEALKPRLRAVGVRAVEERIGRPARFLANVRQRGTLRVGDFLAVCSVLDLDPGELITTALEGEVAREIRRPKIMAAAWRRVRQTGGASGRRGWRSCKTIRRRHRPKRLCCWPTS